jgi:alginate O-acetyltransferase complex protein AlgI
MSLLQILIAGFAALLSRFVFRGRSRQWFLLCTSIVAIYWLQPTLPIRYLGTWLPTLTIALAMLGWALTSSSESVSNRINWHTAGVTGGIVALMGLSRFVYLPGILPAITPPLWQVLAVLVLLGVLVVLIAKAAPNNAVFLIGIAILVGLFCIVKTPGLSLETSIFLHQFMGQSAASSSPLDIRWLGFSYVAFRLIHTLRERQMGKLASANLQEYLVYILFFPAFTSGPIDRVERFSKDLRLEPPLDATDLAIGGERFVIGLFKKFVLADSLGIFSLSATNAQQITANGWTWILLYAYAFQIYFDFSGYTDIAIGLGRWIGIRLPENFNRPYLQTNLTLFWNNWHMSLTQWFRAYFFNPVTRSLRKSELKLSATGIVFITQMSTMILIGLWHGVTWNFVLWGGWHGLGLFIQNRWSQWNSEHRSERAISTQMQRILNGLGVIATFHFVALGWVWFVLPSPEMAIDVFKRLLNIV